MDELIQRLEAASEGSRELDAEIAALCHPTDDPRMAAFENGRDYPDLYTTSIDAALTLISEGFVFTRLERDQYGIFSAEVESTDAMESWYGNHANMKLALCVAALRARQAYP